MIVYLVTNNVNGKIYVGKTESYTERQRLNQHVSAALTKCSKMVLYNAIRKHGPEAFTVSVLATANTTKELNELEEFYIRELRSTEYGIGYNSTFGGEGSVPTPELLKRISAGTRAAMTPEVRAKISKLRKGKSNGPCSDAPRENIRSPLTRRHYSPDQSARHSHNRKTHCKRGHEFSPENTYVHPRGRACLACYKI